MKKIYTIILFALFGLNSNAQFTTLFTFNGTNGEMPASSLVSDGTFLYGMTWGGNSSIFKIKPDGTGFDTVLTLVLQNPMGSLYYDGTYLYGTSAAGGIPSGTGACISGCGFVFKIKPNGSGYANLLNFNGTNGNAPYGSLISDGTYLYGMTKQGGTNNGGVIFKVKPDGTGYLKLLDFNNSNGWAPYGDLYYDGTYLYGMTSSGGTNGYGTIFKIKPDGTGDTVLLNFNGSNAPHGSLISDGTFLYGMTQQGGTHTDGNIFKIKTDGTGYVDLFDFSGPNGYYPTGSLLYDGTYLYGMTSGGGTLGGGGNCVGNGCGLIFKIKPDGTGYTILEGFEGTTIGNPNGSGPKGSLISDGTCLYGMTTYGGSSTYCFSGCGTVFKLCGVLTGIVQQNTNNNNNISIYPNPTNGTFIIKSNTTDKLTVDLFDVNGRHVFSKSVVGTTDIDANSLGNGIYTLTIKNSLGITNKKLVIAR
jgi:uncharacterized repeat protein (TIGR03803 family)